MRDLLSLQKRIPSSYWLNSGPKHTWQPVTFRKQTPLWQLLIVCCCIGIQPHGVDQWLLRQKIRSDWLQFWVEWIFSFNNLVQFFFSKHYNEDSILQLHETIIFVSVPLSLSCLVSNTSLWHTFSCDYRNVCVADTYTFSSLATNHSNNTTGNVPDQRKDRSFRIQIFHVSRPVL